MLNILQIKEFNEENFYRKYKVYEISKKKSIYEEPIIKNSKTNLIYSTCYADKKKAYILVDNKVAEFELLNICFGETSIKEVRVSDYVLLALLINSLSNRNLNSNNIKGSLYRVVKTGKKEIVSINLKIKDNLVLTSDVKTFTQTTKDDKDAKYLYYQCENYMNEANPDTKAEIYKSKSLGKNTVNFYDTDDSSSRTKTFVLFETLEKVNSEYKDIIKVGFTDVEYNTIYEGKRLSDNRSYFSKIIGNEIINIVPKTEIEEEFIEVLKDNNFKYEISDKLKKDRFNLLIIEGKQYYKELDLKDEHLVSSEYIVQNFVQNGEKETYSYKLKQCLLEFKIKKEAINKKTELFDFKGSWNFGKLITKNDVPRYNLMAIKDNSILEEKENVFWDLVEPEDKECLLISRNDDMIKISPTDIRVLPNFEEFKKDYDKFKKAGIKSFKNKSSRDIYYPEIVDIGVFTYNNEKYYTVGPIGTGIQRVVGNFSSVKKVDERGLKIEDIVDMLKENLVSVNKYSVYPYPFKLMEEVNKK